ncbi:hypothetical protein WOLCODRAFT_137018 [Wolfiporia cocos MD-104 SS10]|uniref:Uncharacterized protein n=1 Tax=Wolfiporia cocos (strain MD-104) TaxID=742152 RepID=A0A2H3JF19_WOLCO|nr:hypothetical protein WOLCODRAFT_137018 [Wolfiporia cocos MD-104 SS10]
MPCSRATSYPALLALWRSGDINPARMKLLEVVSHMMRTSTRWVWSEFAVARDDGDPRHSRTYLTECLRDGYMAVSQVPQSTWAMHERVARCQRFNGHLLALLIPVIRS